MARPKQVATEANSLIHPTRQRLHDGDAVESAQRERSNERHLIGRLMDQHNSKGPTQATLGLDPTLEALILGIM